MTTGPPTGRRITNEQARRRAKLKFALASRRVTTADAHIILWGDGGSRIDDDISSRFTAAMASQEIRICAPREARPRTPETAAAIREAANREDWDGIQRIVRDEYRSNVTAWQTRPAARAVNPARTNSSAAPRRRASQISRRSHRTHGPPDQEGDLSSLRPTVRAIAVYRRELSNGPRFVREVDDALIAAGFQPRSGTPKAARKAIGVRSVPSGFQRPHMLWLDPEPHPPLRDGSTVTHSRMGETLAEQLHRHQLAVHRAREVLKMRARITGVAAA